MLRFLEALNPWNSCFTATDFEDALIDITVILNAVDSLSNNHDKPALSFQEKKTLLENAFKLSNTCLNATGRSKPDKQLAYLMADILRQYAVLCFDENYFASKQILLIALNLHLYTIDLFSECIDLRDFTSLKDLQRHSEAKPALFRSMEESILTTSPDRCMALAYKDSFVRHNREKRLQSLAETVKWLGYSYQNIDENRIASQENDLRFSQLFDLSESLYLFIDNEDGKKALSDLYATARPFMHLRQHPQDSAGIFQHYQKALAYDSSPKMQARVGNEMFTVMFANGQKPEAVKTIRKAMLEAESLEDNEEKDFLLSNLYDNYASYLMDPETLNLEEAEVFMEKNHVYASKLKLEGRDHLQFAVYDMRYAEYKLVRGEFAAAEELATRALDTIHKQPKSMQPHLLKAEALQSIIRKLKH